MKKPSRLIALLGLCAIAPAAAQSTSYASIEAAAGVAVQIGIYSIARRDCGPGPLPVIQMVTPPKHGAFIARRGTATTNQIANCPNLNIPAQIVFYQAQPGYSGPDQVVYSVTNARGVANTYDVTIAVKERPAPPARDKLLPL